MNLKKTLLLVGVGVVSAAAGVAVPLLMGGPKVAKADAETESHEAEDSHAKEKSEKSDSHGTKDVHAKPAKSDHGSAKADSHGSDKSDGHGKGHGGHGDAVVRTGPQFIPFGRIVVNLNEPALTKYLSLDITLQVDGKDEESVRRIVTPPPVEAPSDGKDKEKHKEHSVSESRLPILRTWLTSHLADKTMEDIRGKVGINRLRREIQDQFNALMFDDGRERVRDVLFEEFHVE